jgi:hypothetical protein
MDITNPVLKLCLDGIQAETSGVTRLACTFYMQAWDQRKDDYDACVAAHYLARQQETSEGLLHWNMVSLTHAESVSNESVSSFYPSLYLNIGKSYELLGKSEEARKYYQLAATKVSDLTPGSYADIVQQGIQEGLNRSI